MIFQKQIPNQNKLNMQKCNLCFEIYDRQSKKPYLICVNHHTCCGLCVENLKNIGKCPFCKDMINFSMIAINNQVLKRATNSYNSQNLQQNRSNRPKRQQKISNNNRNNQQVNSLGQNYYQSFLNQNSMQDPFQNKPKNNLNNLQPSQFPRGQLSWSNRQYPPSCSQIFEIGNKQYHIYSITFLFQIPFLLIDLAFAIFGADQQCYDKYLHGFIEYTIRKVFFFIVGMQVLFMVILLINAFLRKITCLSIQNFRTVSFVVFIIWMIKAILWMLMEYDLFDRYISENCSGVFYSYCLLLAVINGIIIGIIGIIGFFRGN